MHLGRPMSIHVHSMVVHIQRKTVFELQTKMKLFLPSILESVFGNRMVFQ